MAAILCTAPCKFLCGGCKLCSDGIGGLCTNPLSAFVALTLLTQIPLAVAAGLELGGLAHGCKGSQWLAGMLSAAIAHLVASLYLSRRVVDRTDEALRERHSASRRLSYLLCHDPWIALYLLMVLFFAVWLCVGSGWSLIGRMEDSSNCDFWNCGCGSDLEGRVGIVLGLGWFYLFAGPTVLSCNLCFGFCDKTDYAADDAAFAAKEAEKEAKKQRYSANNNNNNSPDIETPNSPPPTQTQTMPETKKASSPPVTSTATSDGVPIVEAYAVGEEYILPPTVLPSAPPMPPSKDGYTAQAAKAQAKAHEKGEQAFKFANQKVGRWLQKKKNSDGKPKQPPDS